LHGLFTINFGGTNVNIYMRVLSKTGSAVQSSEFGR